MPFRQAQGPERSRRAARQFEGAQEIGHGGDFVALVLHTALAEDQAVARGPRADDHFGALPGGDGAAQRLAIDGDDFVGQRGAQALRPAHERVEEALRIERGEEPVERVVAGDAVGQFQKGAQPGLLGVAEKLHVLEALRPAEQRADGDEQDVFKLVQPGALDARIG